MRNRIQLLIGGITANSVRAVALSLNVDTLDLFLGQMRRITEGVTEQVKRPSVPQAKSKSREVQCRNYGKKGHSHKECRSEPTCFYCKAKGHRQFDCPIVKKKETMTTTGGKQLIPGRPASASVVAALSTEEPGEQIVIIQGEEKKIEVDGPFITVSSLMGESTKLITLIDIGSPVSLIRNDIYLKYLESRNCELMPTSKKLINLNQQKIGILGVAHAKFSLKPMGEIEFEVALYVLANNTFQGHIIIGREDS